MRQPPCACAIESQELSSRLDKVELTFDERNFPDGGAFLFAQVLDRFLSEFISINSFVETDIFSAQRGKIAHWGPRRGDRPTI